MRDIHGRYKDSKPLQDSVPEWARGCDNCTCGIEDALELTGVVPLYLERLVQLIDRDLVVCECKSGVRYRSYLLNVKQKLIEEARTHPMMQDAARRLTHPDIENARWKIAKHHENTPAPTIHYEVTA